MGLETELIVRYFGKVQPLAMQAMRALPHASMAINRSMGEFRSFLSLCRVFNYEAAKSAAFLAMLASPYCLIGPCVGVNFSTAAGSCCIGSASPPAPKPLAFGSDTLHVLHSGPAPCFLQPTSASPLLSTFLTRN